MLKQVSFAVMSCALLVAVGCAPESVESPVADAAPTTTAVAAGETLCGGCGECKGSESCCSEDAAKCAGCGLNEGSELCCVVHGSDAEGKDMCTGCGEVAGTEECCSEDAEKCGECGMNAGAPLCCKIEGDAPEAPAEITEEPAAEEGE